MQCCHSSSSTPQLARGQGHLPTPTRVCWGAPRQRYGRTLQRSIKEEALLPKNQPAARGWLPQLPSLLVGPFSLMAGGPGAGAKFQDLTTVPDFQALHQIVVSGWTEHLQLTDILSVLSRAVQLACSTHVNGPTLSDKLLCKAVVSLLCLNLLDEGLERLEPRKVAGILNALGLLVAYDLLPGAMRGAPRELVMVAQELTHRARAASLSGHLGPNQLAGALRGAVLLSPHLVSTQWLQAVQAQLSNPAVISRLAPESVAALLGSITHARQGRLRRWQPDEQWLMAVQQDVIPRLADFNGFELATTVYGFADLTTPNNPLSPPASISSLEETAALPTSAAQAHQEWKESVKAAALQKRVAELQQVTGRVPIAPEMQQLHPSLIAQARAWESECWGASAGAAAQPDQQSAGSEAAAGAIPSSEASVEANPASAAGADSGVRRSSPAAGGVTRPAVPPLLKDVQAHEMQVQQAGWGQAGDQGVSTARAATPGDIGGSPAPVSGSTPEGADAVRALCPRDLALLLVSYTRLSAPGFTPSQPRNLPALEVLWAQQSRLDVDLSSDDDHEDE